VTVFDTDPTAVAEAPDEIVTRARRLVALERATAEGVEAGLASLTVGRSLLQTCKDADWIIEAGPEDLRTKQKIFESAEAVAEHARAITSSTSSFTANDVAARSTIQHRCFVVHPLNPPELIPLVEIVPGPETDRTLIELMKGWLRALGRIPVEIQKPIPGNVATRIAAAVWREAIDLVLEGVIDVDDLDRAVSVGPAIGWAAAGPHLTYHLAAGERGVSGFLQHLLQTFESIWADLPTWSKLEPEQQRKLVSLIEKAYDEDIDHIRPARDRRLAAMLRGMERAKEK
jgi:3-hydroxypropionate dehydrogenase (NADP+)